MEKKYFDTSFANNTFEKVNDEFLKCTVAVCSHEQIANGTKFTKEALNNALPTLNYLPVIGYFKDGDFSDHGIELVIDNEGFHEVVKTIPFGVVIKDSYRYQNLTKDNGETEEYLVCDVYLWSRYEDAINVVKNNQCNQSMEVNVLDGSWKENYYEITNFNFSSLCILGEEILPAFKLAKIRTSDKFSKDDFKANYSEMISALDKFLDFEEGGNTEVEDEKKDVIDEVVEETIKVDNVEEVKAEEETIVETESVEEIEGVTEPVDYEAKYNETLEELNDIKSKYVELESELNKIKDENVELAKFKADIDKQIKDKEIEEELKPFEALAELDEYKEIYARRYELSLDKLVKEMKVLAFDNSKLISKQGKKKFEKGIIKVPVIEKDLNIPKVDKAWSILDKHIK